MNIQWPPDPEKPPIDLGRFDWFLSECREEPSIFSRNSDSDPQGYLNLRVRPTITVTLDWGDRRAVFYLREKA